MLNFSEFFEFSSENSFPQTPKSTAKARASTVASCAAPAKTLRRVQLNSPNGLAYHLFTHMLCVQMLWTPVRYRLQNIETCVLTDVRRFEKPQRRDHAFFALRQNSRFLYVSLL